MSSPSPIPEQQELPLNLPHANKNATYVRWATQWHANGRRGRTGCGREIPANALYSWQRPALPYACGRCFDV